MTSTSWEHQREVRDALRAIVSDPQLGTGALSSAETMSNLLKDLLPDAPRETSVLVAAAEAGLAQMLLDHVGQGMDVAVASSLTASAFAARTPFTPEACDWAVGELSVALGLAPGQAPRPDAGQAAPGAAVAPPAPRFLPKDRAETLPAPGAAFGGRAGDAPAAAPGPGGPAGPGGFPAAAGPGDPAPTVGPGYPPAPGPGYPAPGYPAPADYAPPGQQPAGPGQAAGAGYAPPTVGPGYPPAVGPAYQPPGGYAQPAGPGPGYAQPGWGPPTTPAPPGGPGYGPPASAGRPPKTTKRWAIATVVIVALAAIGGVIALVTHTGNIPPTTVEPLSQLIKPDVMSCKTGDSLGLHGLSTAQSCTTHAAHIGLLAYQFSTDANYQAGLGRLNLLTGFTSSAAGTSCPPASGKPSGTVGWHSNDNPSFSSRPGQTLECYAFSHDSRILIYLWTLPTQRTILVANDGASGATFGELDTWWSSLSYG